MDFSLSPKARIIKFAVLCVSSHMLIALTSAQTWVKGDVFAGIGNGQYNVYSNAGVLKQTITDTGHSGFTTGCAFTKDFGKLYTTNFSNDVVEVYDGTGTVHPLLKTIDTSSAGSSNEDIDFNQAGDFFVGHADGSHGILKFDSSDSIVTSYFPQIQNRGTDWFDLAADQKTLFYASEGTQIKRFDLSTNTQLADFASVSSESYALRLLPPFDGSGGLLVASTSAIYRLDSTGAVKQTYNASGATLWFALNLDPDGTSFWSGDLSSGLLYRFNIESGAIEVGPINTVSATGGTLAGVCVRDEIHGSVDTTPPVVSLFQTVLGPPKQVILNTFDTQSGLKSIVVNACKNCTAVTGAFKQGTNSIVHTTATKTDQAKSSSIEITATDVAGNKTTYDPVDLTLENEGSPTVHTLHINPLESVLMITNGKPGMVRIMLRINDRTLPEIELQYGEQKTVNIKQYIEPMSRNRVEITAQGRKGATAWLVFTEP